MRAPIYLDYAATTPVDPAVAERMSECLTMDGIFANPASRAHMYGWQAEEVVEEARGTISALIGADPREVVFTSGATESNNLAIKGYAQANSGRGKHIVTSAIEHKAVLDTCVALEQQGFEVTYLQPGNDGLINPEQVTQALRSDTILVSLMHVNNELGAVNPVAAIGAVCREKGVALHVDAAQSAGKLAIDVNQMQIDLLSVSAHKMYGPKGIGILFVRRSPDINIAAQIHGGGHERGMRSGTLPTHQIAGFGKAAELAAASMEQEQAAIKALADEFWQGIAQIPGVSRNGSVKQRVPGILNVTFAGCDGEALLIALNQVAVSTGSACTSASVEPSYVLKAIGLSDEQAHSALRFSLGRFTTQADIAAAVAHIGQTVTQMQKTARLSSGGI